MSLRWLPRSQAGATTSEDFDSVITVPSTDISASESSVLPDPASGVTSRKVESAASGTAQMPGAIT